MTELLAPAGSLDSLRAAVNAGADAVYIGGSRFGARAYAENPDEEELIRGIEFCHLRGKKLYLTVNTLLKQEELFEQLVPWLLPYYKNGVDALIVQDLGAVRLLHEIFPDLELHASTQMSITSAEGAEMLLRHGVTRIVPARELTLAEVRTLAEETGMEIETFIHGAMCYSYSGRCLLSSMLGGRSGNRGRCAQPCRLPYKLETEKPRGGFQKNAEYSGSRKKDGGQSEKGSDRPPFLLSMKDLCTLDFLPELADAGIASFKIEGRMKRPEYTAGVVEIYRKYLDLYEQRGREGYRVLKEDKAVLLDLFNRGGFSRGYYCTKPGPAMMSMARPGHLGTQAASLKAVKGRQVTAAALEPLHAGDMLDLGDGKETVLAEDVKKGAVFHFFLPAGSRNPFTGFPEKDKRYADGGISREPSKNASKSSEWRISGKARNPGKAQEAGKRSRCQSTEGKMPPVRLRNQSAERKTAPGHLRNQNAEWEMPPVQLRNQNAERETIIYRTRSEALLHELSERYLSHDFKVKINGRLRISSDSPVILKVWLGGMEEEAPFFAEASGDIPVPARTSAITAGEAERQILRTGSTAFEFEKLTAETEEGLFVPVRALNELRRDALDRLRDCILDARGRRKRTEAPACGILQIEADKTGWETAHGRREHFRLTVLTTTREQLFAVTKFAARHPLCLDTVYLDAQLWFPSAGAAPGDGRPDPDRKRTDTAFEPSSGNREITSGAHSFSPSSGNRESISGTRPFCLSSRKSGRASEKQSVCRAPEWDEPDKMTVTETVPDCVRALRSGGVSCFLACPPVMRRDDRERFLSLWRNGSEGFPALADGFLVQTPDQLSLLQKLYRDRPDLSCVFAAEDCLYTMNTEARQFLDKEGVRRFTLPAELNYHELLELSKHEDFGGRELIVYGCQPLMHSAQCLRRNTEGCTGNAGFFALKDRRGVRFPVLNRCNVCCNTIYNSVPLRLFDCRNEIRKLSPGFVRLSFSVETEEETQGILAEYLLWLDPEARESGEPEEGLPEQPQGGISAPMRIPGASGSAGRDALIQPPDSVSAAFAGTRGHFRRGVE